MNSIRGAALAVALLAALSSAAPAAAAERRQPSIRLERSLPATAIGWPDPHPEAKAPLEDLATLLASSGPPGELETLARAEHALLESSLGFEVASARETAAAQAEAQDGESIGGRTRQPITASDLNDDNHDDAVFFETGFDQNSFPVDVHLTAHDGKTGAPLWSKAFGNPLDLFVWSPGDVTGDGAEDLMTLSVNRTIEDLDLPCDQAACIIDHTLHLHWDLVLISGPTGAHVWQRPFDGSAAYTGAYAFGPPVRHEVTHVEGVSALVDVRLADDLDADGLDDLVLTRHDFSGDLAFGQLVSQSNDNHRYSAHAEAVAADSGQTLLTREVENNLGTAFLVPSARGKLLWTVPTRLATPTVCAGTSGCVKQRYLELHVEQIDASTERVDWETDFQEIGLTSAAPVMTGQDLTGDGRADPLIGLGFSNGTQQLTALSGAGGSALWTVDTVISDPPTVLPSLDHGLGNDILLWEGWEPTAEEAPGVIFRIRLRRVDGSTGDEHFQSQHDLTDGENLESIFATSLGDVDRDGFTDIGHAVWRYHGSFEESGTAASVMRVESGADGSELLRADRDRKALLFPGGDWIPGGQRELFEASVPRSETDLQLSAVALRDATALWSRTDIPFTALFGVLNNPSGDGDNIVYGRTQFWNEAPRWRSRIDVLRGRTGRLVWGLGHPMGDVDTQRVPSVLSITERSARSAQYSDTTQLEARLADRFGFPIPGAEVRLDLGSLSLITVTDESGLATIAPTVSLKPGTYELGVAYAGSDDHLPADAVAPVSITKEDTWLGLTIEKSAGRRTLVARVMDRDDGARVISGRRITFFVGSKRIGHAVTGDMGTATFKLPYRYRNTGKALRARFAGDGFYKSSSVSKRS
jgi:hypothetical protein